MTLSELLTRWKAEDARLDRQIEIDIGGGDFVSRRAHVEQLRLLRERTTALETALTTPEIAGRITCADCKPEYGDCLNAGCYLAALPPAPPQEQERHYTDEFVEQLQAGFGRLAQEAEELEAKLAASPPAQEQERKWYPCACGAEHSTKSCPFEPPARPDCRRVPDDFSFGYDSTNAGKAWLHGYDTATAAEREWSEAQAYALEEGADEWKARALQAEAKLASLPPAHGWQPMETCPKHDDVLLGAKDGAFIGRWGLYCEFNIPKINGWMPLPAPPVAAQQE